MEGYPEHEDATSLPFYNLSRSLVSWDTSSKSLQFLGPHIFLSNGCPFLVDLPCEESQ